MIPDDQVEEVRRRADIIEIVGEVVKLKKAGKEFTGLCPFHDERSPSFGVDPGKGVYHCFGCGASGDVFTFVREKMGLDFVDAVKYVAGRSGVEIREVRAGRPEDDPLRPLYEALALARRWYRDQLLDAAEGASARAYLSERGVDEETSEAFGLGYAPDDWRRLREAAGGLHGISDQVLTAAGLVKLSDRGGEPYDVFRGRLLFPIEEGGGGRVIGFGGRTLGPSGPGNPKYLNTPETPLFHKGEVLFGLHRARNHMRRQDEALVVEGYMDVLSLAVAGFENAVAPLGTALTLEQARLLRRYTQRVLLLFDADRAGQKATFRSADLLLRVGVRPLVVTLPPGEDPDTLVRRAGAQALRAILDGAVDVLDRKLQMLDEHGYFDSAGKRRDAVDKLLPTLQAAADPLVKETYVAMVSEKTGVSREALMARAAEAPAESGTAGGRRSPPGGAHPFRSGRGPAQLGRPKLGAEHTLLRVLARDRQRRDELLETALERIGPEDFKDEAYRAIFQAFLDEPSLETPPLGLDRAVADRLDELLAEPPEGGGLAHAGDEFRSALRALQAARLDGQIDELQERIEASRDPEEQARLVTEKYVLQQERRGLGSVAGGGFARRLAR